MKRFLTAIAISAFIILATSGCLEADLTPPPKTTSIKLASGAKPQPKKMQDPVIIESGYSIIDSKFRGRIIQYGVVIANPNTDSSAYLPKIRITLKDADRQVISTYDQSISKIYPGEMVAFGGMTKANGNIDKVEFEPIVTQTSWKPVSENFVPFQITGLAHNDTAQGSTFTGELANPNERAYKQITVSIILRDRFGKIVAGYNGIVSEVPANGQSHFEIKTIDKVPGFSKYEAYAITWS